jgi:NADH-quinone oxidoreductase subunit C/D
VRDMNTMDYLRRLVNDRLPAAIEQTDDLLTTNEIITNRSIGVGVLSREDAIAYSAAGPVLRASGVPYDLRRNDPYSIYPDLEFDVAMRTHGDIYDRYLVRVDEMRESIRILKQILRLLDETKGQPFFAGKGGYNVRVAAGDAYGRVENPKGELGYYVVSDGGQNPWRYHVRAPSFINLTALEKMCQGNKVADVVAILGSIDIVLGELDR